MILALPLICLQQRWHDIIEANPEAKGLEGSNTVESTAIMARQHQDLKRNIERCNSISTEAETEY